MPVPVHLQDRHYKGAAKLGHGEGYKYAHDYPKHYVKQQYLPDGMEGTVFYEPSDNGYEKQINCEEKIICILIIRQSRASNSECICTDESYQRQLQ